MINVVYARLSKLSHHYLSLLTDICSPRETNHMNRKVRRESVQTGVVRVNSIPVQSRRSFRDLLVQSLQSTIRDEEAESLTFYPLP